MERPSIREHGGIFDLNFPDVMLSVRVDRLIEDSKHQPSGEVTIASRFPTATGRIHRSRLNLMASRSRVSLANDLAEYHSRLSKQDWTTVLEYVSSMVLDKYREGEPTHQLSDLGDTDGMVFRLPPFLQERQSTVLFGEGDTGKSWMGLLFGYVVATGTPKLGMLAEPGNVLYLDYETDEQTVRERLFMLAEGFNEAIPDGVFYRHMHQTLGNDFEKLNQVVIEHSIDLIIVDSGGPAVGEPELSGPTYEYFKALRALGVTNLTIAHMSKTGRENEPFGSIVWRNQPRANFRVFSDSQPGSSQRVVGLKQTKSNNGKLHPQCAYVLDFGDRTVEVTKGDIADIPVMEQGLPIWQRITRALSMGALRAKDIAEVLDLDERQVRNAISNQKNRHMFVALGEGLWGLSYKDDTR